MRFITASLISLLYFFPMYVDAANNTEPIVLKEKNIQIYDSVLSGFRAAFNKKIQVFDIGDESIRNKKAPLVITIGSEALAQAVKNKGVREIVYAMVLSPDIPDQISATGVDLVVSFGDQFKVVRETLPAVKRIGILYSPETSRYFNQAMEAAAKQGLTIVGRLMVSDADIASAMGKLNGKIDLIFLLPDSQVLTVGSLKYIMLYSDANKMPVFGLSQTYVENGALMALSLDPYDIGRQAGEMVKKISKGENIKSIPPEYARKWKLILNMSVAQKMGIPIPKEVLKTAVQIR